MTNNNEKITETIQCNKEKFKSAFNEAKKSGFRGWRLPFIGVVALFFTLYVLITHKGMEASQPLAMPPTAQFSNNIAGIGIVEPKSEFISIGSELPGIARDIYVSWGDFVKKDTPLFALDLRDINAQIEIAKAKLHSALVQSENAQLQFNIINSIQDKRARSQDEYNNRKYNNLYMHAQVDELKAQLKQLEITRDRMIIKSPIDGQILQINIHKGEYVSMSSDANNSSAQLMLIGDTSTLHVRVEIDEELSHKISPDAYAKAFLRGDTTYPIPLKFVRFEHYIIPKQSLDTINKRVDTRVLQVIYALPQNASEQIFSGKQMDVFIDEIQPVKYEKK